jgi:hypothetical protein
VQSRSGPPPFGFSAYASHPYSRFLVFSARIGPILSGCKGSRAVQKARRASPRVGDTALVDGENFDLVVARQNNFTRGSADQSPRDGRDIRY